MNFRSKKEWKKRKCTYSIYATQCYLYTPTHTETQTLAITPTGRQNNNKFLFDISAMMYASLWKDKNPFDFGSQIFSTESSIPFQKNAKLECNIKSIIAYMTWADDLYTRHNLTAKKRELERADRMKITAKMHLKQYFISFLRTYFYAVHP